MSDLLRGFKDRVPASLKSRYRHFWRRHVHRSLGTIQAIEKIIHQLETVPLQEHLRGQIPSSNVLSQTPSTVGEIEINDNCNIDCAVCRTSESKRQKGMMDLDLFERIVQNLVEQGMRSDVPPELSSTRV